MDPNTALANLRAAITEYRALPWDAVPEQRVEIAEEIVEAAEALDGWLSKGGFLPDAWAVRYREDFDMGAAARP